MTRLISINMITHDLFIYLAQAKKPTELQWRSFNLSIISHHPRIPKVETPGLLAGWLAGWLDGWLAGWLAAGWLAAG